MLRLECFSRLACQRLLDKGYTHFAMRYRADKDEIGAHCNIITFEAVKGRTDKSAIPIRQIMDLPDGTATKYYLMHTSDELEQA